jgi:hypothetical protein
MGTSWFVSTLSLVTLLFFGIVIDRTGVSLRSARHFALI